MEQRRTGSLNMDGGVHEVPIPGVDGRMWLCGKHFIGPDPEAALHRTGSTHVVCLVQDHELRDRYPDYVGWLRQSGRSTWFPIPDLSAPPLDVIESLFTRLHERLVAGESLIVHCAAGIGRAGTVASALCVMSGMGVDDAVAHVRRHRPGAGPEAGSQRVVLDELHARLND